MSDTGSGIGSGGRDGVGGGGGDSGKCTKCDFPKQFNDSARAMQKPHFDRPKVSENRELPPESFGKSRNCCTS
jgi:hypothetical protein